MGERHARMLVLVRMRGCVVVCLCVRCMRGYGMCHPYLCQVLSGDNKSQSVSAAAFEQV